MSTVTALTMAGVDRRIQEFRSVLDRTTGRLVELDADVTRRLLEGSRTLRGATAEAWADAAPRHAALWRGQLALESLLAVLVHERGSKKTVPLAVLVRLDELLDGTSVELPIPPQIGAPHLTDDPTSTAACSIADVLEQMSSDFDVVRKLVDAVAYVWGELTDRLHQLATSVSDLERQVQTQGVRRPNDLVRLISDVAEAEATALEDPMSFGTTQMEGLTARGQRVRETIDHATGEKQALVEDLVVADEHIGASLEMLATCLTQLEAWSEKIVVPEATLLRLQAVAHDLDLLRKECDQAQSTGGRTSPGELRFQALGLEEEVRRLVTAEGAPMERRDELRGLLGAYRAKANAVGLAENLEIDALVRSAHDALYVAPCSLEEAETCVTELRRGIDRLQRETTP
jgi:hypothetical protein